METAIDFDAVRRVALRHDLLLVALFGSRAAGEARDSSDVDLAVLARTPRWDDPEWGSELEADLAEAFRGLEPDLSILNAASPLLLFQVARSGRPLFEAEAGAFASFRARAARQYYDDEPRRRRQAEYLERLSR